MIGFLRMIMERRHVSKRLSRMNLRPSLAHSPKLVPTNCPVCGRPIAGPVFRKVQTTAAGDRDILVCTACHVLGPMDSILTAAAERAAADHPDLPAPG
ncbi:hypothetical protein A7E75_02800 [Syntrophotalea acetylenica]|uniref:Uncharacterized protein n=1 Tax=Syntrophotalea acetylenica TaxID=29542 RepID=A0A1L3GDN4_SYNAC|nr:hypothetical protein A7E75_02800 [Syntrophotalea acetylenica]APG44656.1 hypothetical protein A6070_11425 [Syntrophotalea acetylenica]APG45456.1 hypothetical protein A6070_14850 [Syntrophotalea acetylenica]